jgi:hypothetical protein
MGTEHREDSPNSSGGGLEKMPVGVVCKEVGGVSKVCPLYPNMADASDGVPSSYVKYSF